MEGDVGRRRTVAVQNLHLMRFGHGVLAAVRLDRGSQQGLLGGRGGGGQVLRSDLLCHQLLLDFIDQD